MALLTRFPVAVAGAVSSALSLTAEELRRRIQGRKREKVLSLEEKRKLNRQQVKGIGIGPPESRIRDDKVNIVIIDIDNTNENGNLELSRIQLQSVPRELRIDPEAIYANIAPIARNNPFYHYTGGEDTLELTLDWYSDRKDNGSLDDDRTEVLRKCKWLESKSRNNGLEDPPHRIKLLWGGEDFEKDGVRFYFPPLFNDAIWIVHGAPYDLSLFHKEKGLRPTQAIQKLTLKRVTESNRTTREIQDLAS